MYSHAFCLAVRQYVNNKSSPYEAVFPKCIMWKYQILFKCMQFSFLVETTNRNTSNWNGYLSAASLAYIPHREPALELAEKDCHSLERRRTEDCTARGPLNLWGLRSPKIHSESYFRFFFNRYQNVDSVKAYQRFKIEYNFSLLLRYSPFAGTYKAPATMFSIQ